MAPEPKGSSQLIPSQPEPPLPGSQNKRVSLSSLIGKKKIEVYETRTGVRRTCKMKDLGNSKSKMLWEIPVEKWKMSVAIIVGPEDEKSKKGKVQIASVPIPLSMAVQRSIFGQDRNIYATTRM
ncbi:hypothetical protein F5Y10DRAFT_260963 [Nemania abortiva]|nr:hypothetical protein F5Y10DRAFT_260963 [Nemania abortiva]